METVVYVAFSGEEIKRFPNRETAIEWITECAAKWNYGLYRTWTEFGYDYYDVGPRVFKIKHEEGCVCSR